MIANPLLNLSGYRFTASIDYVTLKGLNKVALPPLNGKAKRPRSAPNKLTVQEPSVADVRTLAEAFPSTFIDELEVFIDVRTTQRMSADEQDKALKAFKEFVAKRLKPSFVAGTNSGFRGAYDPFLKKTIPYNLRIPGAEQQLLNGHRKDSEQVKCYYKRTDHGKALPVEQHCIRLEIRLDMSGLDRHGLLTLPDLLAFKFRKALMPYFTHVNGTRRRKPGKRQQTALLTELHSRMNADDLPHWERIGVGAFLPGGKREKPNLIFIRDTAVNDRIGQALGRLERSFVDKKIVRQLLFPNERRQASMRVSAHFSKSAMTYLTTHPSPAPSQATTT